jgi:putative endonuclease
MKFYLYILKSQATGRYYIGSTSNLKDRIKRHNQNRSKATKNRGHWQLVYTEEFTTRSKAVKREYEIKHKKQ